MKITVLSGSARHNGNTEYLAKTAVEKHAHTLFKLKDYKILPIDDMRHDPKGFAPVEDDYEAIIEQVLESDILIFATPIYWYGMSGQMKNFIDRWSQSLRDPMLNFKEHMSKKKAYVIICGGDQAKIKGLPLIMQFKHIFEFMGMEFGGYIIGEANAPNDILNNEFALESARRLLS
ncbi:flavodoxin family protein [Falsibacillus albus]|uniref:Flavodoxin family protein n=1 Tax=Falsibacillus albus TaxID=2478915 RepID=A0A3L7K427_9BACI|nr:flavodoxin family protein [Falsibacillus albus]RLQ97395.1 flavodoxin family protein [Falsibacillus albus]